nr:hypothetical protein [Oscillospiraceae bacterium]
MKRTTCALLAALLATLLLAGCAQKTGPQTAAPEPAAEPAGQAAAQTAEPADAATPPEVENNGGYYLRVGQRVYFRRYGADALPDVALFGSFASDWSSQGESALMAYDTATDELTTLYTDAGAGPLWYADGALYLCEYNNGAAWTARCLPDGSGIRELCPGAPLGTTDSGLLAVERCDAGTNHRTVYTLYRDGVATGSWETEYGMAVAGLTDDGLFLVDTDYADETNRQTLWQLTPEGTPLCLGTREDKDENYFLCDLRPDRFLAADGKVTVCLGSYAGTGHFLNGALFLQAEIGRENSLTTLDLDFEVGENDLLPELTQGADGSVTTVPALPGALRIGWENRDALELWEDGAWQTLAADLAPSRGDGWGGGSIVQHMDFVDGAAYVTLAETFASPANDVGWREAERLVALRFLRVARDGTVRELACTDCAATLYGWVWFIEGANVALVQELTSEDGEGWFEASYAYAVPIADDALWDDLAFDGVTGLLPGDYGADETDAYGYPIPDAEPAGTLCLPLDRYGCAEAVQRKDPAAVLTIDFDVPTVETEDATVLLPLEPRPGDEDTRWFWALLRALDDVHLRIERGAQDVSALADEAAAAGLFLPEETVYDGTLRRGESIALRASLPWYPELRVSVDKGGASGAYVFGEDNYLHLETEADLHPQLTLAAYPPGDLNDYSGDGLREALAGGWLYRPTDGAYSALLTFRDDGTAALYREGEETALLETALDRLYADEWRAPDLLCLRSEDPVVTEALGFGGSVGDYGVALFRTDGETLLCLTQQSNGDGALGALLPDETGAPARTLVFSRSGGAAD